MDATGDSFKRQMIAQIVFRREFLRLPMNQWCLVKRSGNLSHINLQAARNAFSVCRTPIDFGA